jgi:hypothetical protein
MFKYAASLVAAVIFVLFAALNITTVRAQNSPVNNIVLVHGAWVDGSGWEPV